ncbi:MAG: hypothetical protein COV45_06510 [Deltaproteobacteria bacterium CG11_big_fil_rev_8_21_14_0_20_47_16]|nr:MAG: hypothetical protein COV45_06510 [Deltaproteobacteria bacterium CG11_big_fil_rev_8_21_14_0_20_47_16]
MAEITKKQDETPYYAVLPYTFADTDLNTDTCVTLRDLILKNRRGQMGDVVRGAAAAMMLLLTSVSSSQTVKVISRRFMGSAVRFGAQHKIDEEALWSLYNTLCRGATVPNPSTVRAPAALEHDPDAEFSIQSITRIGIAICIGIVAWRMSALPTSETCTSTSAMGPFSTINGQSPKVY